MDRRVPTSAARTTYGRSADCLRFEEFELDLGEGELRRNGRALALSHKALDVLKHLIRNRERLVSRDELVAAIWPGVRVGSGSLTQAVWEIRKALRDPSKRSRVIKTRRSRGYRFVAAVQPTALSAESHHALALFSIALEQLRALDARELADLIDTHGHGICPPALRGRMRMLGKDELLTVIELATIWAESIVSSKDPRPTKA